MSENVPQVQIDHPAPATPREISVEQLFVRYVGMGDSRKYGALSKESNVPTSELIRHATKFMWRERVALIHCEANVRTRAELVETIAEINSRHITKLKAMQEKAFEYLEEHPLTKTSDAIKLVTLAMKMEREAVGLDQNSEQARLSDLLMAKMDKLLDSPALTKKADVVGIEPAGEFPDPDQFNPEEFPEPDFPEDIE